MTWQPRINPLSRKLNILCKKKKKSPVALLSIRLWFQVEHIWGFLKCREKHFKQENKKKDPLVSNKSPSSSISVGLLPWLNRNSHTSYNTPSYQISPPVFCSAFSASPLPFSSRTKKKQADLFTCQWGAQWGLFFPCSFLLSETYPHLFRFLQDVFSLMPNKEISAHNVKYTVRF